MQVSAKFLLQFLGECLQVERSGLELYKGAISRREDDAIRQRLELFRDQTSRHVEILEDLIQHYGGQVSGIREAMATVMGQMTSGLSALQGTGEYQQWKDLDNLLTAERKCHSDWEILKNVATVLEDRKLADAVAEVERDEDQHVQYLEEQVLKLAPRAIVPAQ